VANVTTLIDPPGDASTMTTKANNGIRAAMVKLEMNDLQKRICSVCDGYAHTERDCPSKSQILLIAGSSNQVSRAIHDAFHAMTSDNHSL
jgi:hypothetical protein